MEYKKYITMKNKTFFEYDLSFYDIFYKKEIKNNIEYLNECIQ